MNNTAILKEMGIQPWYEREQEIKEKIAQSATPIKKFNNSLYDDIINCQKCELKDSRTNVVFGSGNLKADILVVGEAPGAEEDQQAAPFVGRSGQLLTKMLAAININRADIFVVNVLKCRPPENADPTESQIKQCRNWLDAQIDLIQPKFIMAFGKVAGNHLLNANYTMADMRQKIHTIKIKEQNIPMMVIYHPAYLLYQSSKKSEAWEDLKMAKQKINNIQDNSN
ncbi:MAG: uracil-DNA glycosylase [Gammaproteobacteria bacterium]|nr:MAG: uracil-DNA glycosylase [Gammaproteobacteria bacterium]